FAQIAQALAIDGIAIIIGVEPEPRLEGDGGEKMRDGVVDVRLQARRKLAIVGRLRRALARFEIDARVARQAREAVDAVALQRHPMGPQVAVFQHEAMQPEFLGHLQRAAVARQRVVEGDDGVDFLAPLHATEETLPIAVAPAIDDAGMGGRLQILAALADSAVNLAPGNLNLPRQSAEKRTKWGPYEKKDRHWLSHPCSRAQN